MEMQSVETVDPNNMADTNAHVEEVPSSVEDMTADQLLDHHIKEAEKEDLTKDGEGDSDVKAKGEKGADAGEGAGEEGAEKSQAQPKDEEEGGGQPKEKSTEPGGEAYIPNLTYKHLREEKQMPEELAGVIKTKEQEDFYRDLFHKAEGFDFVQEKREKAEQQLQQYDQTFNEFMKSAQLGDFEKAWTHVAGLPKPSLQEVMRGFGFQERDLVQMAYEIANRSPEQAQAQRMQAEQDRRMREMQMQMQGMEQTYQQTLENQIHSEFDQMTQDQEFGPVIKAFEEKHGNGAFFQEVATRGAQISQQTGRILSPKAIAKDIISRYNLGSLVSQPAHAQSAQNQNNQGQPAPGNNSQSQPAQGNKRRSEPEIIPAVDSEGGSPGQRVISSPEDLEKLAREELGISIQF
jgi:hypothetical protein